jgi:hypothetical protein
MEESKRTKEELEAAWEAECREWREFWEELVRQGGIPTEDGGRIGVRLKYSDKLTNPLDL